MEHAEQPHDFGKVISSGACETGPFLWSPFHSNASLISPDGGYNKRTTHMQTLNGFWSGATREGGGT